MLEATGLAISILITGIIIFISGLIPRYKDNEEKTGMLKFLNKDNEILYKRAIILEPAKVDEIVKSIHQA